MRKHVKVDVKVFRHRQNFVLFGNILKQNQRNMHMEVEDQQKVHQKQENKPDLKSAKQLEDKFRQRIESLPGNRPNMKMKHKDPGDVKDTYSMSPDLFDASPSSSQGSNLRPKAEWSF